ncbi:histidine phosphatase family protein [Carboxydocella sp. JDF658]|uniref:histidine phosphatase family protein n=1 Tax=Carboxydocella sp. JDF658 TaxID=1926600 RepID=UPI0009ABFEE4|nr:histidine phosphatase family protein [Carboxydocella sp. JDF658]GAW31649.1 histidine phosphatase family protein [Carboxydocella sp. JDF658]
MTRIILARHGETNWNREGRYQGQLDTELSPLGWQQAERLAEALAKLPITAVYSSPLSRAYETARKAAEKHQLPVEIVEGLTEIHHGCWQGLYAHEVKEQYGVELEIWQSAPHQITMPGGGECLKQVQDRAVAALEMIAKRHPGETVLVLSHDATIRAFFCYALGMDLANFWLFRQDNTCINVVEYLPDGRWRLSKLNDTCHLGSLIWDVDQKAL